MQVKLTFSKELSDDEARSLVNLVETNNCQLAGHLREYIVMASTASALWILATRLNLAFPGLLPSFSVSEVDHE